MDPTKRTTPLNLSHGRTRPGQDIIVAKKAAQFPSVGMALPTYQTAANEPVLPKPVKTKKRRITLKRTAITLLVMVLLVAGFVGGKFLYNAHKLFGSSIFSFLSSTKLKGEDSGRVNILLAGNSADDPGHSGANLTDSIMLISIDTRHNNAFMLSIPRDLWVHIPGDGHEKINDAYVVGQNNNFSAAGYPDGGMGQLEQTVSEDLNVPIDYYALVDYTAFKDSVNAVGGIDVTIKSNDPRGLYDPSIDYATHGPLVRLTNGVHQLNGQQALDLARARGDAYGSYGFDAADFDRTAHQRQMLIALKSKAETVGVLANPAKLTSLSDAIGNNVKTDMKLNEVHRLYDLTKKIGGNNIQSLSLNSADGKNLLTSYSAPDGESALIPARGIDDYTDIQAFINRHTSSSPVVQEGAKIVVLNGTVTNGLAVRFQRKMVSQGYYVTAVGDARTSAQATTTIIDASGGKKPATSAALTKMFGTNITTTNPYAQIYDADFIVVLGQDQAAATTSTTPTTTQ